MKILITIPAYNEARILETNILKIFDFCQKNLMDEWQIAIVNNQSTDQTAEIAQRLAAQYPAIKYLNVELKGKGAAIKSGWQSFTADIYCFMDADLATDLAALPLLIEGIKGGNDLVIGNRFDSQSKVQRSFFRRLMSAAYRRLLEFLLSTKINDAPCGFKAINCKTKDEILPQVKNLSWFFDSELILLAESQGYKIKQIPVVWLEPRQAEDKSRVKIFSLAVNYFTEVWQLRRRLKTKH